MILSWSLAKNNSIRVLYSMKVSKQWPFIINITLILFINKYIPPGVYFKGYLLYFWRHFVLEAQENTVNNVKYVKAIISKTDLIW